MGTSTERDGVRERVIFVPGGILPAALQYGPLLQVLGDEVQPLLKDLEIYATESPPADYGLELEVEGLKRAADAAGFDTFHIVSYSAGQIPLAFTTAYPARVRSLALVEPGLVQFFSGEERAALEGMAAASPEERMQLQNRIMLAPGVAPPPAPPGPPPPWMSRRMAGGAALVMRIMGYVLDEETLRRFRQPVYVAIGTLSSPTFARSAEALQHLFPDCRVEVYEGRHHLDPPHRAEPERFATALRNLWQRADGMRQLTEMKKKEKSTH